MAHIPVFLQDDSKKGEIYLVFKYSTWQYFSCKIRGLGEHLLGIFKNLSRKRAQLIRREAPITIIIQSLQAVALLLLFAFWSRIVQVTSSGETVLGFFFSIPNKTRPSVSRTSREPT